MERQTREALIQVVEAMYKSANNKIGGIKRMKYISDSRREHLMLKEVRFQAMCSNLIQKLNDGTTRSYPIAFLRKDQHNRTLFRANLEYILGDNHPEIENIVNFVFYGYIGCDIFGNAIPECQFYEKD